MRALMAFGLLLALAGCREEAPVSKASELPYSKWRTVENKDPITDVTSRSVYLTSGPVGSPTDRPAEMHFRCTERKFEFYLSWNRYLGSNHKVETRIDDDPYQVNNWSESNDKKSSFYPFADKQFLNRLSASKKYVARVTSNTGVITASFDTIDVAKNIAPVRELCDI